MSENLNTGWTHSGRAHYTRHIDGVRVVARKVGPGTYGGEAEINGERVTVLNGTIDGAKKSIVIAVNASLAAAKRDGVHTLATDKLAALIVEEAGAPSGLDEYAMGNVDGMTAAWRIVTGIEIATEEAIALAAARHSEATA